MKNGMESNAEEFKPKNVFCATASSGKPAEAIATMVTTAIDRKMGNPRKERTIKKMKTISPAFTAYSPLSVEAILHYVKSPESFCKYSLLKTE
ncbi:hypothetical protein SDC9_210554 [bioreactor metagenome]|uniref:Uncharacterized protein n=1 Tax=bioreactor metagenome TaxID=1076179 RepID=A0A645JGR1_9ZZZZ